MNQHTSRLKNGGDAFDCVIVETMRVLRLLMQTHPSTFREFVDYCRATLDHPLSWHSIMILEHAGLLEDREDVPGSIWNIVLSAVEGDGTAMRLTIPLQE